MDRNELVTIAQRLREYVGNPHHIDPISDALKQLISDASEALSRAAQPQGEPLIHINPEVLAMLRGERKTQAGGLTYSQSKPVGGWTVPLYAEQPAPVAVASLEIVGRQCFPSETMKKIPNYRTEPWVDGDVHQSPSVPDLYRVEPLVRLSDVTRLNPSL